MMYHCDRYDPDNIFKRFKVIKFPTSFVGLWTRQFLDVEIDLSKSAYLKTMCDGRLMKFNEAQEVSASHRSFTLHQMDDHTVQITFHPINECISHSKNKQNLDKSFVFDLRLIQVDGLRCCYNEFHSEVGRYYISGQYEFCTISHFPNQIYFGNVIIETKITKDLRIRNESRLIAAKFEYVRVPGFEVHPSKFTILPNATQLLSVTTKPTCLMMRDTIAFRVRNPHDDFPIDKEKDEKNFLIHKVACKVNVVYNKTPKSIEVESLHKLNEQDARYTFVTEEDLKLKQKSKETGLKHLQICKSTYSKKAVLEKYTTGRTNCIQNNTTKPVLSKGFCEILLEQASTYDLFEIFFLPFNLNFGHVALNTHGLQDLTIKNNTNFNIVIQLNKDDIVCYTKNKLTTFQIKITPMSEIDVTICCLGIVEGTYHGTFTYEINNKYRRQHPFCLQVANPTLLINDKSLKFGMLSSDSFITSVPVRIKNHFNIPVEFRWEGVAPDTPFEIIPQSGIVPKHTIMICDIIYTCKATKTKTYEIDFVLESTTKTIVPVELNIMTRKLAIKFLQAAVWFKDIPLNLETIERVKMENASRQIATFHVVEPLIPGLRVEPMNGNIYAKMVQTFDIVAKIPCVLEFDFDIILKINNKDNVTLPVSGNVVEPKITICPKNIFMSRIPSKLISYVPITFQNLGNLKTLVEVQDIRNENVFDIFVAQGNEKHRIFEFFVEGGQSKTVFMKIYDVFRREYDMYLPFKINGLLGPPDQSASSLELKHYIKDFEKYYENNSKVKIKSINKDISYCRVNGVITVPWLKFSVDDFEIEYIPNGKNQLDFTLTNVSRYCLNLTISTAKLSPYFSLSLKTKESLPITNENCIMFELDPEEEAAIIVTFHPKGYGKFVATANLFLDKHKTVAYSNLTFIGKRLTPTMVVNTPRIIFPPCYVGSTLVRAINVKIDAETDIDSFSCFGKEERNLEVKFVCCDHVEEKGEIHTLVTIKLTVTCNNSYARTLTMTFNHESGSGCEVEIFFCFTYCPLTLHTNFLVTTENNPYPYFPLSAQKDLYDYLETSRCFLEKWMFQQGFRRELFPVIPDTFYTISVALSSLQGNTANKSKTINVSYLNFMRRIAGPLMKNVRKITVDEVDETVKHVKEIYGTYKEIVNLIKSRGVGLWTLQARFLLSHEQFVIHSENNTPKCNADIILTKELLHDVNLFNRLSKQSWIDLIMQSYRVFIMDSCFFDCLCVSSQPRDIVKHIIDWYNEQIVIQHYKLRDRDKPLKVVTNITSDLSDGIALTSAFLTYCPFLADHFSTFCEVVDAYKESGIINNACLVIEAMNHLRLFFPLGSKDFLQPNFVQMLFLSIHLYVILPMFKPKDTIMFHPPNLRSSTRHVAVGAVSQESLIFNYVILNNKSNNFVIEKGPTGEIGKKILLSVKFMANFTNEESCVLLIHGYNKTRIFDTYVVFILRGQVGALNPAIKCKVTGPIYRPHNVDIFISSPFPVDGHFSVFLTDAEPTLPVSFEEIKKTKFYVSRLTLIDTEIYLSGDTKEIGQSRPELTDQRLNMKVICLSTQVGTSWIWFRGEMGQFYIKVTTHPRWDLPLDTLQARLQTWPMDPCSCGETCECYRTTILRIPHRNDLMVNALRYALLEHASDIMLNVFDRLIDSTTGKIILGMLLEECGTNMSDVNHILRSEINFRIYSSKLIPRLENVKLLHHTNAVLPLTITIPSTEKSDRHTLTFISDCGMDIRTYRVMIIEDRLEETGSN